MDESATRSVPISAVGLQVWRRSWRRTLCSDGWRRPGWRRTRRIWRSCTGPGWGPWTWATRKTSGCTSPLPLSVQACPHTTARTRTHAHTPREGMLRLFTSYTASDFFWVGSDCLLLGRCRPAAIANGGGGRSRTCGAGTNASGGSGRSPSCGPPTLAPCSGAAPSQGSPSRSASSGRFPTNTPASPAPPPIPLASDHASGTPLHLSQRFSHLAEVKVLLISVACRLQCRFARVWHPIDCQC